MKRNSLQRYMLMVLIGYAAVAVFIAAFVVAKHDTTRKCLGLKEPLTETTALVIAAIMATPILLPFGWKRLTKLRILELELNFSEVEAKGLEALPEQLGSFMEEAKRELDAQPEIISSDLPFLIDKLTPAILEAETPSFVKVKFSFDKPQWQWWSTRLYLLASLAEDYTNIRQLIFLEKRQEQDWIYAGSATPAMIRQALAADNPTLSESYKLGMRECVPSQYTEPAQRVAWLAYQYVRKFKEQGGEEQIKQTLTKQTLDRCLTWTGISIKSVRWNGDPPPIWLIYEILMHPEPYVVQVSTDGRLNRVVNRLKLAEQVAKITLRHSFD